MDNPEIDKKDRWELAIGLTADITGVSSEYVKAHMPMFSAHESVTLTTDDNPESEI